MPYVGPTFNLINRFGTGDQPNFQFPPRVGEDLDDIATALDLTTLGPAIAPYVSPHINIPCFSANNAASPQTILTNTPQSLLFPNIIYNVGGYFAASLWTPPAGKIALCAAGYSTPDSGGTTISCAGYIAKNSAVFRQALFVGGAFGVNAFHIALEDIATGSDVYGVWTYSGSSTGTASVGADNLSTWFMGHWIST
jgi:hypothetical protein